MDARISTSLPSHPKTKKLARRLGPAGPLGCIYLFLWVAANRSDGDLSGLTDEDLELAVDWQGDDGQFVAAMSEVGFLDGEEGSRSVHDWAVHNPWAAGANERSEASRWAALCKRYGRDGAAKRMPNYANGVRPACEPDAPRTNPQCDPDAPSPIPSPSPLPIPKQEQEQSPADASESVPAKPKKAKSAGMTLSQFAEQCRSAGEQVIPADDPIFAYAGKVGIPTEYVGLAWRWFKEKYGKSQHKQADWRAHFRNSVRSIWCKYWSISQDGTVYLTASGKQAQREANA